MEWVAAADDVVTDESAHPVPSALLINLMNLWYNFYFQSCSFEWVTIFICRILVGVAILIPGRHFQN